MLLYSSLAEWWPLLSPPSEYADESAIYAKLLSNAGTQTMVEFGSGGGSNAYHLKQQFEMTLVDVSPDMLAVSRDVNPDCEHIEGDMRTARLHREFDRVFIHDAICYMTTVEDLRKAMETAYIHCRPGGVALFVPDFVEETFLPATSHGGYDGERRALRYLDWAWDPDPSDTTYVVDYAYMLRDENGSTRVEHERHIEGLFPRAEWLRLLTEVGFQAELVPSENSEFDTCSADLFLGIK